MQSVSLRHYKFEGEFDRGMGMIYVEVDWNKDLVVRQVDVQAGVYSWGKWTGTSLVGYIADQPPSGFEPPLASEKEVSAEEFESVWKRATQTTQ